MARWKELPATLDHRERQLVVQLRRLKDRSGLSLAALAARTTYSSSSWERYLNGKKPIPRDAVGELARVCGTDPTRLLVLQEVAESAGDGPRPPRTGEGAEPEAEAPVPEASVLEEGDHPAPKAGRAGRADRVGRTGARWPLVAGVVAAVLVAFGAGLAAGLAWPRDTPAATGHVTTTDDNYQRGHAYPCHVKRQGGALSAGHSDDSAVLLDTNSTGWAVVEAQCLLTEHGFDAGRADGLYGEGTKSAARAFQRSKGLVEDGIVGPDTWRELRG
ncbi:helix-turn-helix domain-containing protein [Streptomyces sp. NPDC058001]|uniref:helix-turn-helix domain-containing protein n=1 Tax=Streptomyces sp. NPDC058001 TaxID=3346300 RepID=UPI0036E2C935